LGHFHCTPSCASSVSLCTNLSKHSSTEDASCFPVREAARKLPSVSLSPLDDTSLFESAPPPAVNRFLRVPVLDFRPHGTPLPHNDVLGSSSCRASSSGGMFSERSTKRSVTCDLAWHPPHVTTLIVLPAKTLHGNGSVPGGSDPLLETALSRFSSSVPAACKRALREEGGGRREGGGREGRGGMKVSERLMGECGEVGQMVNLHHQFAL
jgi:hypothetical protein